MCASCQPWGCDAAGFSTFPAAHGSALDGFLAEAQYWNHNNCDLNKVAIHEIGHYFNLLHTFEGGCKNDDCLHDGDRVCDTPPDNDNNYYNSHPCTQGQPVNSCNTDVNALDPNNPFVTDQNDMSENYMDYAPAACAYTFTPGQAARMEAAILGPRISLLYSKGCEAPCLLPVTAAFTPDDTSVVVGSSIDFMNTSVNASSYIWQVDGQTYTTENLSYTFDSIGIYKVLLTADGDSAFCQDTHSVTIHVHCGVLASFMVPDTLAINTPLTFINASVNPAGNAVCVVYQRQPCFYRL